MPENPGPVSYTDDFLALAIARAIEAHSFNAEESENLGYYRTRVTCACGEDVWWGERDNGDPSFTEAWTEGHVGVKSAEAVRAALVDAEREMFARILNPTAFDPKAIYSPESRGAEKARAYSAADNLIAAAQSTLTRAAYASSRAETEVVRG